MMKTVEKAIRDKILYIGNEIPIALTKDPRPKFIVLGSPQELIDETSPLELNIVKKNNQWTLEELAKHIRINSTDTYSLVVPLAALLQKFYGKIPEIGLSGFQGESAEKLSEVLPNAR